MDHYTFEVTIDSNKYNILFIIKYQGIVAGIDGEQKYASKAFKIKKDENTIITLDDFPCDITMIDFESVTVCLINNIGDHIYYYYKVKLESYNDLIITTKGKYPILCLNNKLPYRKCDEPNFCNIL